MDDKPGALLVRFPDLSPTEASRAAAGLEEQLRKATAGQLDTELCKERTDLLDAQL